MHNTVIVTDKALIKSHCSDVRRLLSQSYWAENRSLETIEASMDNSLCYAVFHEQTDTIVAFARAVTDHATMYYICDVIVDEMHRGRGLGKSLVNFITGDERLKGMYSMLLTDDAQGLYEQFGFSEYKKSCMFRPAAASLSEP